MEDFLIIGVGVAGVSAAARLAPLGRVRVVEAEEALGTQASGRSAAMFVEPYGNAIVRALNTASAEEHQAAGVLAPRALLMLAGPGAEARLAEEAASFGAETITAEAAQVLLPILRPNAVGAAALYRGGAEIDTHALLQHYVRAARGAGARLDTGTPVTAIVRANAGWTVTAGGEEIGARHLVNAAGAWADKVAALAGRRPLGLTPYRRSMARLPAPGGRDTRDWPFALDVTDAWYAKPDAGGWIVSPSEEDPMEPHDAWADDMVIAEGLDRYSRFVTEPVTRVETTWAGLRTFAPDRALVLGPDPVDPTFLWCAGQGGYGFQTAPAAARLLADLAAGRTPELPPEIVAALAPNRLRVTADAG